MGRSSNQNQRMDDIVEKGFAAHWKYKKEALKVNLIDGLIKLENY